MLLAYIPCACAGEDMEFFSFCIYYEYSVLIILNFLYLLLTAILYFLAIGAGEKGDKASKGEKHGYNFSHKNLLMYR